MGRLHPAKQFLDNGELKKCKESLRNNLASIKTTDDEKEIMELFELVRRIIAIENIWISLQIEKEKTETFAKSLLKINEENYKQLKDILS